MMASVSHTETSGTNAGRERLCQFVIRVFWTFPKKPLSEQIKPSTKFCQSEIKFGSF